jgi:hypothetical protein
MWLHCLVTRAAGALYAPAGRVVGCIVWSCLGSGDGYRTDLTLITTVWTRNLQGKERMR